MQHKHLTKPERRAYRRHLQSDHDFEVYAEVLTLEERPVSHSRITLLDGQVNLHDDDGPDRTCTLTLSDPEHALQFGSRVASDETGTVWVNRLIRVTHAVVVPGLGRIESVPFIGVPTSVARSGGELGVELSDKSLLADHGTKEKTYRKDTNAAAAIRDIMQNTGEERMHIPAHPHKLKKPYTVGMKDEKTTPWMVAQRIAARELDWRLEYEANGFLRAEKAHANRDHIKVEDVLALPDTQADFTEFGNYVKVTSKRQRKKSNITDIRTGIATLPAAHELSAQSLARNGQPRWLPLVIEDDDLKSKKQVDDRAISELRDVSGLDYTKSYGIIPLFHLDNRDRLVLPYDIGPVPFDVGSIPLGVTDHMVVGDTAWVSRPVVIRRRRVVNRHRVIKPKKKKKGDRDNG